MKYWYQRPPESIAQYVRTILIVKGAGDEPSCDLPLFTNGSPAFLCRIKNGAANELTLFGESVPEDKWEVDTDTTIIAYLFKPFMLATVFGVAASTLKENPVQLSLWSARKTIALNLQLANAQRSSEQFNVLNGFIEQLIASNKRDCDIISYATDLMMQESNTDVLARIPAELNLTERTFQRIFKKYVGTTPNQYRRICQFYFAFARLRGRNYDKLTDIAYTHGYFDQSHYIRSFKEFAGTTPNDYLEFGLKKSE